MPYKDLERRARKFVSWKVASRQRAQEYVLRYLRTHPCVDCGETDPVVLDFDHREPETKFKSISDLATTGYSLKRIGHEIAKCDVRCANCHRRRHHQEGNRAVFTSEHKPVSDLTPTEKIRQSKLGIARSEETKARVSEGLKGNHNRPMHQLAGRRFGRLVVTETWEKRNGRIHWLCKCDCGSPEKWISSIKLTTGSTQSCGCLRHFYYGNQTGLSTPTIKETGNSEASGMGVYHTQACAVD